MTDKWLEMELRHREEMAALKARHAKEYCRLEEESEREREREGGVPEKPQAGA